MRRFGVPSEVLTDNGKQFTGRFTRPFPAEVLFERVCRENGISQRLTKRRSPTTTGKIERFHKTLREEFLDDVGAFASLDAAQDAISVWVREYNHSRPHQSLDMATPAAVFRPSTPQPLTVPTDDLRPPTAEVDIDAGPVVEEAPPSVGSPAAVEHEFRIPPSGHFGLAGAQELWLGPAYAGRTVTVWADDRSVHVTLDGHHIKTVSSRLHAEHLRYLLMRGARPAGPAPAAPALPRASNGRIRLQENTAIEVERVVDRDGIVRFRNESFPVGTSLVGQRLARCVWTATSCTPSPTTASSRAGPTRLPWTNASGSPEHAKPPARCRPHHRSGRRKPNAASRATVWSWSPANVFASAPLTPGRSSPSSPRTPASGSSIATKNSPSTPAIRTAPCPT